MAELTIDDLDAADVQQAEEFLKDFLASEYPSLDLTAGKVLRDLLIRPAAVFHVLNNENIDRLRQSMSLLAIEEDPTLADDDIVDGILSNFRVTRQEGTQAFGQVTIVISTLTTTTIGQGTVFTANGLAFTTAQTFTGVTTQDAVVGDQQKLITARTDGTFAFTIPVVAEETGQQFDIRRNTRFTLAPTPGGIVDAFAAEDFSGGSDTETNSELIERFKLGISPSTFAGRTHIHSLLKETVPELEASSITGFGDAEMLRDRHNIFAISQGGKADIWARTRRLPLERVLSKTAVLVDKVEKIWQFTVGRDDAPGFYTVPFVLPEGASSDQGTFEVTAETRGLDLSAEEGVFVPDVDTVVEGAYSRYQTAVLQFFDPDTDTEALTENVSERTVQVGVLSLGDIDTLQDLANDRTRRNPQADYLVKAPVPVFCAVSLTVQHKQSVQAPDTDAIKQAIVDRINGLGFDVGRVPASMVYDAVHNAAGESDILTVAPIDLFAQIRRPDGSIVTLRGPNEIKIPDEPERGLTSRTAVFYIDTEDVDVNVEPVPVLPA